MKGKNLFIAALIAAGAGIALILTYRSISSEGVIITCGILFIIAGLVNIAAIYGGRKNGGRRSFGNIFGWIAGAAAVILGLSMLLFRWKFVELVAFMFALLVAFGAVFQFLLLGMGTRNAKLPRWLFIVPVLMVGAAVYIYVQDADTGNARVMLVSGIAFALFGIATIAESIWIGRGNHMALKAAKNPAPAAVPEASPRAVETPRETENTPSAEDSPTRIGEISQKNSEK